MDDTAAKTTPAKKAPATAEKKTAEKKTYTAVGRSGQVTTRSSATVLTPRGRCETDWTTAATETGVSVFTAAAVGLFRLGRYPARATLSEQTCTMAVSSLQGRPAD
jgi:hypothetical protein